MKMCYWFWYIFADGGMTEYVKIVAVSKKQAVYFFDRYRREVLGRVYDYGDADYITDCAQWINVGCVFGGDAIVK